MKAAWEIRFFFNCPGDESEEEESEKEEVAAAGAAAVAALVETLALKKW